MTNGYEWPFLVLSVNSNGEGASYRISDRSYSAAPDLPPDMIAGLLASWVCCQLLCVSCVFTFYQIEHSCEDLLDDDWLV